MTHILGDNIGFGESKTNEFKEFSLKIDPISFCTSEEIIQLIKTGKIVENFNDIILNNIIHYLKFYVPKYISAFGNMKGEDPFATLYIGINDFGEITGIPFQGILELEYLNEIKDSLKLFLGAKNLKEIFEKIQFEIIKLDVNSTLLVDDVSTILDEHIEKYNAYKIAYTKYVHDYKEWINQIDRYSIRISVYFNEPEYRKEVAAYIRSNTTNPEYLKMADLLETNHEFETIPNYEIMEKKVDQSSIYHWITSYKDAILDQIKTKRPTRPSVYNSDLDKISENQFSILTNLRKKFIDNNSDLNYYLIKIKIPTNNEHVISFSNLNSKWYTRTRDLVDGIACCI
jgi:hypothetical protein